MKKKLTTLKHLLLLISNVKGGYEAFMSRHYFCEYCIIYELPYTRDKLLS